MVDNKPLVSIMIPNYNYGRYLRQCLDSVLNQTYENIDVYFRDNASTDESMDIAIEYVKKFKDRDIPFMIANNKHNIGSERNTNFLLRDSEGSYGYVLGSDDFIAPSFIEKCVNVFINHSDVSLVMTHRNDIDESGNIRESLPFYNRDCIISSEDQAAVFMMAGIALPCQRMYNSRLTKRTASFRKEWFVAGDWYNNFLDACCGNVAYIKEPLCYYRTHFGNETNESEEHLSGSFEHYMLINTFVSVANALGMTKPQKRYDDAVKKLGSMCLRYALKMYKNNKLDIGRRYLLLALVYDETIENTEEYKMLFDLQKFNDGQFQDKLKEYEAKFCLERNVSYDPPVGYLPLE